MNNRSGETKKDFIEGLEEARKRTRLLLASVSDEDLAAQHEPIMSPLIWDYGHIGNYEELWLLKQAVGRGLSDQELYDIYDASLTSRSERPSLAMLDRASAGRYLDAVRKAVIVSLVDADLDGGGPLLKEGFVYHMIIQHEYQHNETMLQTLQLMKGDGYKPVSCVELPAAKTVEEEMILIPEGSFVMGTDDRARALDNERGEHIVDLPDFFIDKTPVTNQAFAEFVEDGGYERSEFWYPSGWEYIKEEGITTPKHWYRDEPDGWRTQRFGFEES